MATSWTIEDDLLNTEDTEWSKKEPLNAKDEDRAWTASDSVLTPDVSGNINKFSGLSNFAVEELCEYPENLDIEPENIQNDASEWTLVSEAD